MTETTRFAWADLNADTVFLALLAFLSGAFDLYDPGRDQVTVQAIAALGHAHPLHYIRAGSYVLAGVLLLSALTLASVRLEVVARCALVTGVALNVWRHGVWLGLDNTYTIGQVALLAIVGLTMWRRFRVLLNPEGLVVTRPAARGVR